MNRIAFSTHSVAPQSEVDAVRAQLRPWQWPTGVVLSLYFALSLYAAFQGASFVMPLVADYAYGPSWWPGFEPDMWGRLAQICGHVFAFASITVLLTSGVVYLGKNFVFGPYSRVSALNAAQVCEAARLAEVSAAVESYRAAVAQTRDFVVGDLDLMRELAGQDDAEGLKQEHQEKARERLYRAAKNDQQEIGIFEVMRGIVLRGGEIVIIGPLGDVQAQMHGAMVDRLLRETNLPVRVVHFSDPIQFDRDPALTEKMLKMLQERERVDEVFAFDTATRSSGG